MGTGELIVATVMIVTLAMELICLSMLTGGPRTSRGQGAKRRR